MFFISILFNINYDNIFFFVCIFTTKIDGKEEKKKNVAVKAKKRRFI